MTYNTRSLNPEWDIVHDLIGASTLGLCFVLKSWATWLMYVIQDRIRHQSLFLNNADITLKPMNSVSNGSLQAEVCVCEYNGGPAATGELTMKTVVDNVPKASSMKNQR